MAVVTGSTSGIGEDIACGLAREGASVVVSGRRRDRGEAIVEKIVESNGKAAFVQADLADASQCEMLIESAVERFGGLDILVNNAGIFPRATLEETDIAFWDAMFAINVRAPFFCVKHAVPHMRERGGGSIINIGSGHPWFNSPNLIAYGTSKGALYTLTRKLAATLARDRIRVNWITVGWVLTEKEFEVQAGQGISPEKLREIEQGLPMGAMNTGDDYAAACVYLASGDAKHVTGTDLNASAGLSMHL